MLANRQLFDCKKIADTNSLLKIAFNIVKFRSIYQGHELRKTILALMMSAGLDKDSRFGDLKKKGFKDLYITTTQITQREKDFDIKVKVFSAEEDQDTPILPILLASSSLPGVFPAVKLKQVSPTCWLEDSTGESFVDGGCTNNFALDYFDKPKYMNTDELKSESTANKETLGLRLSTRKEMAVVDHHRSELNNIENLDTISLALVALNHGLQPLYNYGTNGYRTIFINRGGIKTTQFNISEEEKEVLHQAGSNAVLQKIQYDQQAVTHHKVLSLFFHKAQEPVALMPILTSEQVPRVAIKKLQ
jgi:predicted acylesterase/phospholipase RssA